jgi:hypothetical protein
MWFINGIYTEYILSTLQKFDISSSLRNDSYWCQTGESEREA